MNTLQRIKKYLDFKGINNKQFEVSVGFSNGSFASQLKNGKTIGVDKLENILSIYIDLNPTWLLTGKGDMLLTNEPTSQPIAKTELRKEVVSEELKEYVRMLEQCQKRYAQLMDKVDFKDKQLDKLQEELVKAKKPTNV